MICSRCGTENVNAGRFCVRCGTPLPEHSAPEVNQYNQYNQQNQYMEPVYTPPQPPRIDDYRRPPVDQQVSSVPALVWGILSLAFATSIYLSFLGIIFSCIARSKANTYLYAYGMLDGRARTGRGLAKAGLIVGIIGTVLCVFYIIFLVAMISEGSAAVYGYY